MTLKFNTDDLFSSDILLYEHLNEVKDSNDILKNFFISFPSESQIKNEQYGIFIGHARNVSDKQTSNGDTYDASVIVLITSKQSDYKLAKVGIDLATRELIKEIRKSELVKRGFKWTESTIVYSDSLDIKYRSITFLFQEMYSWEDINYDERVLKLVFEDIELTKGMEDE